MTIRWKTVEQYFTVLLFAVQYYHVCNFGKFINFGLGTVRSECMVGASRLCDPGSIPVLVVSSGLSLLLLFLSLLRGFFSGLLSSTKNQHFFLNSNSICSSNRATSLLAHGNSLLPCLNKVFTVRTFMNFIVSLYVKACGATVV